VVPLDFLVVRAFGAYDFERLHVPEAAGSDFLLVNLFREPVGAPMGAGHVGCISRSLVVAAAACIAGSVHISSGTRSPGNLADSGGTHDEIAELLGHASMSSSQVYLHPDPVRLREAVERVPSPRLRPDAMTPAVAAPSADWLGGPGLDGLMARLSEHLDPGFLAEAGWDATRLVLNPPPAHRLLGRPVCQAPGCSTTAAARTRICHACSRRLAAAGLGQDQLALLPVRDYPTRGPDGCRVSGCGRE
jgi:hypothetical protein